MHVGWRAAAGVRAAVNLPELFVVGVPVVDETRVTVGQRISKRSLERVLAVDVGAVGSRHHADIADDQVVDQVALRHQSGTGPPDPWPLMIASRQAVGKE